MSSVIMTGQPAASEPDAVSTDLHHEDEVLDEDYAITVPFGPLPCQCSEELRVMEPVGCKDCDLVPGSSDLKLQAYKQAIRQTKVRWAWFSGARALDDELSRRLGTLGYLPFEVREKIFRLVLDEYIEEAVGYRNLNALLVEPDLEPLVLRQPVPSLMAMKQQLKDEFEIRIRETHLTHHSKDSKLYNVFCLRKSPRGIPSVVMPLRLATADTQFEFDRIFLPTMTFDFPCPKALQLFLNELSVVQLSQVRSIIIRIYGCDVCTDEFNETIYYKWGFVCAKLPSTLTSISFDLSGGRCGGFTAFRSSSLGLGNPRLASQGMQFLRRQVERIALDTEVKLLKKLDPYSRMVDRYFGTSPSTVMDSLDVMVRENDVLVENVEEKIRENIRMGRNFGVPEGRMSLSTFPFEEDIVPRSSFADLAAFMRRNA